MRGALEGRIQCVFGQGFTSDLYYRFGGHDSRDMRLPEVISNEVGAGVQYGKSRRFRARLTGTWRWLDYNRAALAVDARGRIDELRFAQSDLLREVSAGVQLYRGVLVDLVYGFLLNTSNSYGYSFKAHRMQVLLVRHMGFQFDAQMLANLQLRRYDDPLASLPGWDSEMDEYEQALLVLKLSRQLTNRLDLSLQYGFSRNGARRSGGFYRKHTARFPWRFSSKFPSVFRFFHPPNSARYHHLRHAASRSLTWELSPVLVGDPNPHPGYARAPSQPFFMTFSSSLTVSA